jgi:site-specific DNA-cytosine methylase
MLGGEMPVASAQMDLMDAIREAQPVAKAAVERARCLDLYCCAGGASEGYRRVGFEVVGVDREAYGSYHDGRFVRGDAVEYLVGHGQEYDLVHASPPCQGYSFATPSRTRGTYDTKAIGVVKAICDENGWPCVVENVREARHELDTMLRQVCECYDPQECEHELVYERAWREPLMLCGEMFGLGVIRHRYFEVGGIAVPQPEHPKHRGTVKDGTYVTVAGHGADNPAGSNTIRRWQEAMDMSWVRDRHLLAEAVPPAYTAYIGKWALAWL